MTPRETIFNRLRRFSALLLLFFAAAALALPVTAHGAGKNVRIGWYETPFNVMDKAGRRSGYAYEYQQKLAAYSGWNFTYVKGSWSELMQKLFDGEIDMMSDVSYTEERAKKILYPELPMGTEEYCIFIVPGNRDITSQDYSTLNGKRIGVYKNSVHADIFLRWAELHGIHAELVELVCTETEALDMLDAGKLDAYVTPNAYSDPERLVPVCRIGSSDIFVTVNKDRPDLLEDLNAAMRRIQEENPYYNQMLFEKYAPRVGTNAFLTAEETSWLSSHGVIRVGYQDNYLAFCASNPETGELTGALKDYLEAASGSLKGARLEFKATAFPSSAAALEALTRGEVDCVFPANLSSFDGETMNLVMTPPLIHTDVYAVVRQADRNIFANKGHVVVAVTENNPNYDAVLLDRFPSWRKVYYPNTADCLKAVSERVADCLLIGSYRYNNISRLCERYHLTTISTGVAMDYCFAVQRGDKELYSILSKAVGLVPKASLNAALSRYIVEDAKRTFSDFVMDNLKLVMLGVGAVLLVILLLLARSIWAEKKAQTLIAATETDDLTGLYNRDYFFHYANSMYRKNPKTPMDAIVLNIEQFHSVNALHGMAFGDHVLRILGNAIREVADEKGGIAGRFGADRFDVYCRHTEDYRAILDLLQNKLDALASNTSIRLRMGVMPWQENLEPVKLFDRARTACSMARGHYKDHLIVFDEKIHERELLDQRLLNDLRRALDSYEFEVYYQPKYDIQSDPPRLVSAEALIRWQHPELGLITPDSFIPLLERNGKIGEVDKYVWSEAARQIARWKARFGVTIPVSVNLSRVDVFDPELEQTLDRILVQNGLDHDALKLEVTESAYTENADQVIQVVESLRKKGYTVEMDDFGTGYSSLNMLSAMPINVLKMDRTFIQNIENDEKDVQLVALILGIAKNLDIPVIAEGVETEQQLKLLKDLGCVLAQGYFFSRPLHPAEFEEKSLRDGERAP